MTSWTPYNPNSTSKLREILPGIPAATSYTLGESLLPVQEPLVGLQWVLLPHELPG